MKRTTLLGAVLLAALAVTAALTTPEPAHAILSCDFGGYQTPHHWHMEATCADAQAAHRALSFPEAAADCGGSTYVCAFTLPDCYPSGSMWVVDGPATYGCMVVDYPSCEATHGTKCDNYGAHRTCTFTTGPYKGTEHKCVCDDENPDQTLKWNCRKEEI